MTFLYPIGLLGLVGIPIFIIMYLIKNRYTEQTVASTYLWTLSERFFKRKNPLSRITGIISLILQLLLVTALSLAVAHPILVIPGAADEYCFVLDGSGSMNMEDESGKTRFDRAKDEIRDIIDDAGQGSVFSLVVVRDTTEVVFEHSDNRERIFEKLDAISASDGSVDFVDAIGVAQGYFDENPSVVTYLVTDTDYLSHTNVKQINVASAENNISLDDVSFVEGEGTVTVSGSVISYGADRMVDIEVYDDSADTLMSATKVYAEKDKPAPFNLSVTLDSFYSLTVKIPNEDAMALDNVATVYSIDSENSYTALLVSDNPFFLESALSAVAKNAKVRTISTEQYAIEAARLAKQDKKVSGYGLYIFDAYNPGAMPEDGSVWLIGLTSNLEDSGFSVQREVEMEGGSDTLDITESTSSTVRKLTQGMIGDSISVSKYMKCGLYGDFTTLYSYMGNPIVFTGLNTYGNREVVFAFNFHDSDFVLSVDYLILTRNLLAFSFPNVIDTTEYYCGDVAEINVVAGCNSIRVDSPSGAVVYTDTSSAVSEFVLTEVGEYKVTVDISGTERELYIYSSVPKEERNPGAQASSFNIQGEAGDEGRDGLFDMMTTLFIVAALLFTAEWMVYCYDKYQLR